MQSVRSNIFSNTEEVYDGGVSGCAIGVSHPCRHYFYYAHGASMSEGSHMTSCTR